ncbi:hypothetical protein V3595_28015 [Bacillus sp. CFBP9009]
MDGIRYLDYKKESLIQDQKGKWRGLNIISLNDMDNDENLLAISLSVPYIIEIVLLSQTT